MYRRSFSKVCCFLLLSLLVHTKPVFAQGATVEWEILNRFSPFEALDDPSWTFDVYRIQQKDGDLQGWHKRLSERGSKGVVSPYAKRLKAGKPIHWNPELGEHRNSVLKFVRAEKADDTKIAVRVWIADAQGASCKWSFEEEAAPCEMPREYRIPLKGADLTVDVDGETLSAPLRPVHKVIVALGDSYAAGEGNPDVHAVWNGTPLPQNLDVKWMKDEFRFDPLPKRRWVDDRCHRSFYSYQSLTALKIASDNPHMFVSFLHYACTGAEIFDGLLAPQWQTWGEDSYVPYAQINAALRDLCTEPPTTYEKVSEEELSGINLRDFYRRGGNRSRDRAGTLLRTGDKFDASTRRQREATDKPYPRSGILRCPKDNFREPDHVFLSIGGNDVGFNDLVRYYIAPLRFKSRTAAAILLPEVCPAPKYRVNAAQNRRAAQHCRGRDRSLGYHAGDIIGPDKPGGMANRYKLLFNIIIARLNVVSSDIVMAQYPDPLRTTLPNADPCAGLDEDDWQVFGSTAGEYDPLSPWNGLKSVAGLNSIRRWQFNLTEGEARQLLRQFDDIRVVLAETAKREDITFVCQTRDLFVGRGWWTGDKLNLPNHLAADGSGWNDITEWHPYSYTRTGRAIRTGNDSILTQPHKQTNFTGTAHPNLTGHRLIAQEVADHLAGN